MKIVKLLSAIAIVALSMASCGGDDEPDKVPNVSSTKTPTTGGTTSGSGSSSSDNEDMEEIISRNTSVSTVYKDFYFITTIRTKLVPELQNVNRQYSVVHGEPYYEDGCDLSENTSLCQVSTSIRNGYEITTFKFLACTYWLMKGFMHQQRGEWYEQDVAMDKLKDFMMFDEELTNLEERITNNEAWDGDAERIREIKGYLREIMEPASGDYVQNYFLSVGYESYKIGEWHYY